MRVGETRHVCPSTCGACMGKEKRSTYLDLCAALTLAGWVWVYGSLQNAALTAVPVLCVYGERCVGVNERVRREREQGCGSGRSLAWLHIHACLDVVAGLS